MRVLMLLLGLAGASMAAAQNEDLASEMNKFCDKMKSCATEQMAGSGLSSDMEAMIMQNMEGVCAGMEAQFQAAVSNNRMYQPALACLRSMQSMSCQQLQDSDGAASAECERYEAMVEAKE